MVTASGLCRMIQESFNQEKSLFGDTAGTQCAFMTLFAISFQLLRSHVKITQLKNFEN